MISEIKKGSFFCQEKKFGIFFFPGSETQLRPCGGFTKLKKVGFLGNYSLSLRWISNESEGYGFKSLSIHVYFIGGLGSLQELNLIIN